MEWFLFALLNVLGNGTALFIYKLTINKPGVRMYYVLSYALVVAAIIFFPLFLISYVASPILFTKPLAIVLAVVSLVVNVLALYFFVNALKLGELSFIGPLENLRPLFAMLFSITFLQESPSVNLLAGALLVTLGAMLLHWKKRFREVIQAFVNSKATIYIGLSALLFGLASVIDKVVLASIDPIKYSFLFMLGLAFGYNLLSRKFDAKSKVSVNKHIIIIGFLLALGFIGIFKALSLASPSQVVPIQMTRSLYLAVLGFLILKEKDYLKKIAAAIIMLLGVFLIVR